MRTPAGFALLAAVSFTTVFAFFGQLRHARLGLIDDHEILRFLGSDHRLLLWEIPSVLGTTELANWGEDGRFRPAYYFLRAVEVALR
ncbi:MAG: hypothetical protein BGO94_06490 [Micrococcales bacterium 72-143]|nr:MAG: hypothetical protein BGO94_06490 [Micrococcales bacterium 72-143]